MWNMNLGKNVSVLTSRFFVNIHVTLNFKARRPPFCVSLLIKQYYKMWSNTSLIKYVNLKLSDTCFGLLEPSSGCKFIKYLVKVVLGYNLTFR